MRQNLVPIRSISRNTHQRQLIHFICLQLEIGSLFETFKLITVYSILENEIKYISTLH